MMDNLPNNEYARIQKIRNPIVTLGFARMSVRLESLFKAKNAYFFQPPLILRL
jgi:hypothetical protein